MTQNVPSKDRFQQAYRGRAPWDIGKPQQVFVEAAEQVTGSVLDAGCGTGENALYFAQRGHPTSGIDFLEHPIAVAKKKTRERGLTANFVVMDALHLAEIPEVFDSVIDCGLFHVFSDENRARYVRALTSVVRPGGKLFLLCFSDEVPLSGGSLVTLAIRAEQYGIIGTHPHHVSFTYALQGPCKHEDRFRRR